MDSTADTFVETEIQSQFSGDSTSLIFQNEDIVGVIMKHYREMVNLDTDGSQKLFWAALTSHSFLSSGLDSLWHTLESPFPLLSLLSNFFREESSLEGSVSESDWKKFDDYARRVRVVRLWHNHVEHASVLHKVKALHPHYILPGLKHIDLQLLTEDNIEAVKFYLSPNLTSLDIREGRTLRWLGSDEEHQLSALIQAIHATPSMRLANLGMNIVRKGQDLKEPLRQLQHLSRLHVGLSNFQTLFCLLPSSKLADLDLRLCEEFRLPSTFEPAPRITRLTVIHHPLSLNLFPQTAHMLFPNLTCLKLTIPTRSGDDRWFTPNVGNNHWEDLIFPPNLTRLEIDSNSIILAHWHVVTILPFHILTHNRDLKFLSIRAKIELNEAGLQEVSEEGRWASLGYLRLIAVQTAVHAKPLAILGFLAQHCPKLRRLEIAIIPYTPAKTQDYFDGLESFQQSFDPAPHLQLRRLGIYIEQEDFPTQLVDHELMQQVQYIHALFPNVRQLDHPLTHVYDPSILVEHFNSYIEKERKDRTML